MTPHGAANANNASNFYKSYIFVSDDITIFLILNIFDKKP